MASQSTRAHSVTKYGVKVFEISEDEYLNLGKLLDDVVTDVGKEGVFIARLTKWTQKNAAENVARVKSAIEMDDGHDRFHPEWLKRNSIIRRKVFSINPYHEQTIDVKHKNKLRRAQTSMKKLITEFDFFAENNGTSDLESALLGGGLRNCLDVMLDTLEGKHNDILYLTNVTLEEPLKTTDTVSMSDLNSNLKSLATKDLQGITSPSVYVGSQFSTFCCHREDCAFNAVNRHIAGATKIWFCIPPRYYSAFQRYLTMLPLPDEYRQRLCYMQHKEMWLDPREIVKAGIPVYTIEQRPGDIVVLLPNTIHFGFNVDVNLNEAMNFVSKTWVLAGMTSQQRWNCRTPWNATFELKKVLKDLSTDAGLIVEWETGLHVNLARMLKEQNSCLYPHLRDMGDEPTSLAALLGIDIVPVTQTEDVDGEDEPEEDQHNSQTWATCTRCNYCPHRYMGDAPQRIFAHAVRCHGAEVADEILKEVHENYGKESRIFKTTGTDCEKCGQNIKGSITNMRLHRNSSRCEGGKKSDQVEVRSAKRSKRK